MAPARPAVPIALAPHVVALIGYMDVLNPPEQIPKSTGASVSKGLVSLPSAGRTLSSFDASPYVSVDDGEPARHDVDALSRAVFHHAASVPPRGRHRPGAPAHPEPRLVDAHDVSTPDPVGRGLAVRSHVRSVASLARKAERVAVDDESPAASDHVYRQCSGAPKRHVLARCGDTCGVDPVGLRDSQALPSHGRFRPGRLRHRPSVAHKGTSRWRVRRRWSRPGGSVSPCLRQGLAHRRAPLGRALAPRRASRAQAMHRRAAPSLARLHRLHAATKFQCRSGPPADFGRTCSSSSLPPSPQ